MCEMTFQRINTCDHVALLLRLDKSLLTLDRPLSASMAASSCSLRDFDRLTGGRTKHKSANDAVTMVAAIKKIVFGYLATVELYTRPKSIGYRQYLAHPQIRISCELTPRIICPIANRMAIAPKRLPVSPADVSFLSRSCNMHRAKLCMAGTAPVLRLLIEVKATKNA